MCLFLFLLVYLVVRKTSVGALDGNKRNEMFEKCKKWSRTHNSIFNNMLMVGANELKNKRVLVLRPLLIWLWNILWANLSCFRLAKPRKSNFIWPISIRILIESTANLCAKWIRFWSCCCVFCCSLCVFARCESFIRFAFMSPDVWLFAVSWFLKLKRSEIAVFSSPLKLLIGMYVLHTDSSWFWPTQSIFIISVSWKLFMDAAKKKKRERESIQTVEFLSIVAKPITNESCMFAPRSMHVWTGSN